MKALQLVPAMDEGGVEHYVVQLNRILIGAGWENVVVSCGGRLDAEVIRNAGRVVHQDLKSKNPLTAPLRARRLRELLKRERPDVVCAHSRVPAWLFVLASHGLDIRWITYAHGANSISRYSRVMTCGDRIMCPSNFVRTYLKNAYGVEDARFRVVPHGIDANRFDPDRVDRAFMDEKRREWGISDGMQVVMSIGRITRIKGFDALIHAFKAVRDGEKRKLIIVGGAEKGKETYFAELKDLVRALGMDKDVIFAGQQSKIPECLALADVVVSANTTKPESFGLTMAEALLMGKPVVAKAFGGALDIVRDGVDGVLVRECGSGVIEAFSEAIRKTLDASSSHHFVSEAIRFSARARFDFDIMSKKTVAVYEEVAR